MDDSATSDNPPKASKLKEHSLNWAGLSYIIGDVALAAAGEWGGAWWLAGGVVATMYGHPKAEKQFQLLSDRLGNYLRREGVEIPETPDTESLRRKGGVLDHIESFMYTYPSQILNTAYTIGSLLLIRSGLQPKTGQKRDYALAGAGALVIAGALGGLLIKEKKPDPDHPPQGAAEKAKAWIQEKPLRWPAIAYGLNDVMLAISTYQNKKNNPLNSLKWITVSTYAFGNVMLALSKKNNAGNAANIEALEQLAETSAHVIAAQPPDIQEKLLQRVATFIALQKESHMTADEVSAMLHQKLASVASRGPLTGWQHRTSPTGIPLTPTL
ncbi:MAG: hypothetical protein KGJ06_08750 [Pseudomonadota bacterium]|nr:hypothetical protein [Pseudomonadota bacterium]